jgi:hypothetical protein
MRAERDLDLTGYDPDEIDDFLYNPGSQVK